MPAPVVMNGNRMAISMVETELCGKACVDQPTATHSGLKVYSNLPVVVA